MEDGLGVWVAGWLEVRGSARSIEGVWHAGRAPGQTATWALTCGAAAPPARAAAEHMPMAAERSVVGKSSAA